MDSIDLLALVKKFGGKLDEIEVYGYITSRLPRPINIFDTVKTDSNSMFVKMDVLAVNLKKYSQFLKENGIVNKDNSDIYLVNGSIAMCVPVNGVYPDWYASRGTLRLGSRTDGFYLTLFPFVKSGKDWSIVCNTLDTMDIGYWNQDGRPYKSVYKSIENGFVTVPDDVQRLPRFYARMTQNIVAPTVPQPSVNKNIATAMNDIKPVETLTSINRFTVENRDTIVPLPESYKILQGTLSKLKSSREEFINSLKISYMMTDVTDANLEYMVKSLRSNLKSKPHNSASTGRVLLNKYLSKFGDYADAKYLGVTASKFLIDDFVEVSDFILDSLTRVNADGSAWKLCKKAFGNKETFYAGMLAIILGVDYEKMVDTCIFCNSKDISFIKLINSNPYLLLLISSNYSYSEVDFIAYCMGKIHDKTIEEYKLVGILYDYLTNSDNGSTVYRYSNVLNSRIGTTLTKAKKSLCDANGTYLSETLRCNLYFYVDVNLTGGLYKFPNQGWIQSGYNYILPLSRSELEIGLKSAIDFGLASKVELKGETWVTSAKLLEKELFVCSKMYQLASDKKGYDHELIDKYIDEYEEQVGFKLEPEQREAVHLIDNRVGVVTGSAGSGKTTVSGCMVYVLDKIEASTIEYAAPTGKAAKRLQETVRKPVQTFNSKFKIFGNNNSLFDEEDCSGTEEGTCYFFDEVAMTSIDLMYSVCRNLSSCSVYFLGDISQLPPIGKGLPFKNFLRFLPCVKLNVTKRSAENSGITYNSKVINEFSESNNWKSLEERDDFKIIPCNDDDIKLVTTLLCKYHLNKISDNEFKQLCSLTGRQPSDFIRIPDLQPDDIQVVSPIGKQTYSWGTYQLNNQLQPIFNPLKGYSKSFKYQISDKYAGTRFTIGDRVIHSDSNMYSMQWYSSYKDGCLQKRYGFGISNGEVGKVVAFYPSKSCEILDEVGEPPSDFEYLDNLRDDATFIAEENWFIIVEYHDFMSDSDFYIVYRATENLYVDASECKAFTGDDLKKLNLFYAGTTHKMQGSQNKLIIGLLGRVNFKGFLSRNMLYTEVTRASDGVYLIGSVSSDRNSQLSIARSCVADNGVVTLQELMYT